MENLSGMQLGQYRILEPLGAGGMASVFKAYQPNMDRHVAVKVLPKTYANEPGFLARFQQEARVIASLEHPHILPVHDFGESDGYTYLVMRYVEGGTLAGLLSGRPLALDQIKRIISQLASALDYAHDRGIIHRDVKPSNVLIDPQGNTQLTDFGLAKIVENTTQLTVSGAFLGTPKYASPEQGKAEPLTGKSDIYSLGVILYEMATGRVPFEAETPLALLFKHVHDPLPLPNQVNPAIPEALEKVILKALAKDPADRFASAGALSSSLSSIDADLQAPSTVAHPPIEPVTHLGRIPWKWVVPAGVSLVVLGFLALRTFLPSTPTPIVPPPPSTSVPAKTPPTLEVPPPQPTTPPIVPISAENLMLLEEQILFSRGTISVIKISPGGELLAVGGGAGAWIYQLDGMLPLRLLDPGSPVTDLAWSPDGTSIGLATQNGVGSIWDPREGTLRSSLFGHNGTIQTITWSPDGSLLATAANDTTLRTWSAANGALVRTSDDITGGIRVLSWSPRGDFIASGSNDGTVRLWDADRLLMQHLVGSHTDGVDEVIWSPEGERLMSGGRDWRLRLWDAVNRVEMFDLLAYGFDVPGLAWSPDGDRIVEAGGLGFLGNVGVWDLEREEEIDAIDEIFLDYVVDVDWSEDGARIAGATRRGTLVLWNAATGKLLHESRPHAYHAAGLAWSPKGEYIVTGTTEGIVQLWDLESGYELTWDFVDAPVQGVAWSADGTYLAIPATDGKAYLLNSADLDLVDAFRSGSDFAYAAAWSPDGQQLAIAAEEGALSIWDPKNLDRLRVLEGHRDDVFALAWSPAGDVLASTGNDKMLVLWNIPDGFVSTIYELSAAYQSLAWSPNGDRLAMGGLDGVLRIYTAENQVVQDLSQPKSGITSLAWTMDGQVLAAGLSDGSVRFYNPVDGLELFLLEAHNGSVTGLAYSFDGSRLGTTSHDGAVKVWGLPQE